MTAESHELQERERINSVLESFLRLPAWTPAMGAMLVCGIVPSPNCKEIPESAAELRNFGSECKPSDLHKASSVLEQWTDWAEDDLEGDLKSGVPSSVEPIDFLSWCEDWYDRTPDAMKPSWLRYWLAFAGFEHHSGALMPAPARLVRYAAQIDGTVRTMAQMVAAAQPQRHLPPEDDNYYVARMCNSIKASRLPIAGLIISALQKCATPRNPKSVWNQLVEIVKEQRSADLRYTKGGKLETPCGEDRWREYTQSAMIKFLTRHREKVDASSPTQAS